MIGDIYSIENSIVKVMLTINISNQENLIGIHVVFVDDKTKIVGEIISILEKKYLIINIIGEIIDNSFYQGISTKPSFKCGVRIINLNELNILFSSSSEHKLNFGTSTLYKNYNINIPLNEFFSNHFAILGNSGSGKSFAVSSMLQNLFKEKGKANIIMFDTYGEYDSAFCNYGYELNYKSITTDLNNKEKDLLQIPLWLLDVDDLVLLLGADDPRQVSIIEKSLRLVPLLKEDSPNAREYKNDIIARAIMNVLLSGKPSVQLRDQIFAILSNFNTLQLNLDSQIVQPGYVRTLKQCLYIDRTGKLQEMDTIVEFLNDFIKNNLEERINDGSVPYNLDDLQKALAFALLSEGILNSDKVFDYANILEVRLRSLIKSDYSKYFTYNEMVNKEQYIAKILVNKDKVRCQIVNFNINYVDDRMAKIIVKIMSKLIFNLCTTFRKRGSIPFNIILEEAHRYIQNDSDNKMIGYNIFERIAKEGRKYGVLLGLISQRPVELSSTVISQCSNFIIFRTIHPNDLNFIESICSDGIGNIKEHIKTLQSGNCILFGNAFKIPILAKVKLPNPTPQSNNVDIINTWF